MLRPSRFFSTFLIVLVSLILLDCGGGGKKTDDGISENGGTFTSDDGLVSLVVPKDSLLQTTRFTVTKVTNYPPGAIENTVYNIMPDNLAFLTSVELIIQYDETLIPAGTGENDLLVAKLIDGHWTEIAEYSQDAVANTMTGKINSLSTFALVPKSMITTPGTDIGTAGGTVVSENGKVTLSIPADALEKTKSITIVPIVNYPAGVLANSVYNFGPEGLIFKTPISAIISYDENTLPEGVDENDLWIGEFSEGQWFRVAGSNVDVVNNTVTAPLSSFSIYGIGYGNDLSKADMEAFVVDTPQAGSQNQFDNIPAAINYLNETLTEDQTGKLILQTNRTLSVDTLHFQRTIIIEIAEGNTAKIAGPGTSPLIISSAGSIGLSGLAISNEGGLQLNTFGNLLLNNNSLPATTINLGGTGNSKPLSHRALSSRQSGIFGDSWNITQNTVLGPIVFNAASGFKGQLDLLNNNTPRIDMLGYALASTRMNVSSNIANGIYVELTMGNLAVILVENHQNLNDMEMNLNVLEQTSVQQLVNTVENLKLNFEGAGYFQTFLKGNNVTNTQIGIGIGKESGLIIENDITKLMTIIIHEGELNWVNKSLVVKNKLAVQSENNSVLNLTMDAGVDIEGLMEFILKGDFYYLFNDVRLGGYATILASGNVADLRGGGLRAETGLSLDFDGVKATAYTSFTTGDRLSGVLDYYEPATGSQYLSVAGPEVRVGFALSINHKLLEGGQKPQATISHLKPGIRALEQEGIFIKNVTFNDPINGAPGVGIGNINENINIENCNFSGSNIFAINIGVVNGNVNIKDNTLNDAGINLTDVHGSINLAGNNINASQAFAGVSTVMTDNVTLTNGSVSGMHAFFVGPESQVTANGVEIDGMITIVAQGRLALSNNIFTPSSSIFDGDREAIGLENDPLGESGNAGLSPANIDSYGDWNQPHPCADYPPYRNVLTDPQDPDSCVVTGKTQ